MSNGRESVFVIGSEPVAGIEMGVGIRIGRALREMLLNKRGKRVGR